MKFQNLSIVFAIGVTMAMTACHHHHHHEGHAHDEVLQLTAYSERFEVYAEAEPFVAGAESEIVAHFTFLDSFKPLEAGTVIASLVCEGAETARDTLTAPTKQGIYKLHLTPSSEGQGVVLFRVQTDGTEGVLTSPAVTIYSDAHEAQHAAADLKATSSNGVVLRLHPLRTLKGRKKSIEKKKSLSQTPNVSYIPYLCRQKNGMRNS